MGGARGALVKVGRCGLEVAAHVAGDQIAGGCERRLEGLELQHVLVEHGHRRIFVGTELLHDDVGVGCWLRVRYSRVWDI